MSRSDLPRPFRVTTDESWPNAVPRLIAWVRDVRAFLSTVRRVEYRRVSFPASGADVPINTGRRPSFVTIASVLQPASAALFLDWEGTATGFTIRSVQGLSGAATLTLRVEY